MISILAVSTQRSIGLTVAVIVILAFAAYAIINVFRSGRDEVGSEIELAPNRKPYFDDQTLETRKLDVSLFAGVATLAVIALALPIYWLGEPGRHEGRIAFTELELGDRGGDSFEERCSGCHGPEGVGGSAARVIADESARFITNATWTAPALNNVFSRFTEEEVLWVLTYGRPQSPMPAWGIAGGGPLNTQQLQELIIYLQRIALTPEEIAEEVEQGLRDAARQVVLEADAELQAAFTDAAASGDSDALDAVDAQIEAFVDAYLAAASDEEIGELLFNNAASGGTYGCARCHTAGASWDADGVLADNPSLEGLVHPEASGCGGFGPSLCDGAELRQFESAASQAAFVSTGCEEGKRYGVNGVCDGGGQMPGFGDSLTEEQIAQIVAYERAQ